MTIETQVLLQQQLQNEEGVELDAQNLVAVSKGVNWRNPPLGAVVIAYGVRYEVVPPVREMRCAWRWHAPDSDAGSIDPELHTRSKAWFDEEVACREEHTKSLVKKDKGPEWQNNQDLLLQKTKGKRMCWGATRAIAWEEVPWGNPPVGAIVIAFGRQYEVACASLAVGQGVCYRWKREDKEGPTWSGWDQAAFQRKWPVTVSTWTVLVDVTERALEASVKGNTSTVYPSLQGRLLQQEISRGKQFEVSSSVALERVNWKNPPTGSVVIAYGKRYEIARASESNIAGQVVCAQWMEGVQPTLTRWNEEQFSRRFPASQKAVAALIECPFSTDTEAPLPYVRPNVFIQPPNGAISFECLGVKMTRTFVEKVEIGQVIVAADAKWGNPLDPSGRHDDFASVLEATVVLTPYKAKAWLLGWEEGSQTASSLAAYEASVPIRHIEGPPQKLPFIYIKRAEADFLRGPQWISKGCPDDLIPLPPDASPLVTHVWVIDGSRLQAVHLAHYPNLRPFLSIAWSQAVKAKIKARQVQGYLPCSEKRVYCESQYADDDEL